MKVLFQHFQQKSSKSPWHFPSLNWLNNCEGILLFNIYLRLSVKLPHWFLPFSVGACGMTGSTLIGSALSLGFFSSSAQWRAACSLNSSSADESWLQESHSWRRLSPLSLLNIKSWRSYGPSHSGTHRSFLSKWSGQNYYTQTGPTKPQKKMVVSAWAPPPPPPVTSSTSKDGVFIAYPPPLYPTVKEWHWDLNSLSLFI